MAGVLRTPRPVPGLTGLNTTQVAKTSQAAVATNDEVSSILKGLQLNKQWFKDRIRDEPLQALAPAIPNSLNFESSITSLTSDPLQARRASMKQRRRKPMNLRGSANGSASSPGGKESKHSDFDIYLNEAVMPVLAQSLDALCRQLSRMKEQSDRLDPKVRARFNPLTWLAQQLLRRHPKCARTPRRQLLYRGFKDWADWEKGRRELLRRRPNVEEVFQGFMIRGMVQHATIESVVAAVDDTLHLQGVLKTNAELKEVFAAAMGSFSRTNSVQDSGANQGRRRSLATSRMLDGESWTFEEFWYHFGNAVMKLDIVPYSLIVRGAEIQRQKELEKLEFEQRQAAADEQRERQEAEKRQWITKYTSLYERMLADPIIAGICNGDKILSGDDVRPGDVGFEYEAPPHGPHISMLSELMELVGLEIEPMLPDPETSEESPKADEPRASGLLRASAKAKNVEGAGENEEYWDERLAKAWAVIQRAHHAESDDGVVDREVLKQVLVPPVGFDMLRAKVEYEVEHKRDSIDLTADLPPELGKVASAKPSMEQLCQRLGMTMSRLEWLHKLFETFLIPDDPSPDASQPCCLYPECPASINKEQMRQLVSEVEPNLNKAQFDARFKRLDQDGSGLIEFDEFAYWVHSSDVRIQGQVAIKMTLQELANRYQEPLELINYIHGSFRDQLPEDAVDDYPINPVGLAKQEAFVLASLLTPDVDRDEFSASFDLVDETSRQRGHCDFDEFLEIIEMDDLPAELRDRFESLGSDDEN